MTVKGRERGARPLDVWRAYPDRPAFPKPKAGETFAQYIERTVGNHDPVLNVLMRLVPGGGTQQEYLDELEHLMSGLYETREQLHAAWKEVTT